MVYAILIPRGDAPLGYYVSADAPTPEELADHMANRTGFADREEWMEQTGVNVIGYAPVH
ncbi:beta-lactoglobulin I [Paraburkholderia phytofirmans]|uniref:beta-lactoglobulin I n=1 Tax=Paraburkholderia phytofirmans TaxID=261302 RepID=UPI0038BB7652